MAYRATKKVNNGAYTSLHVSKSIDYGKTWTYHSKITENTNNNSSRGVWEPFLGLLNNKLTVFYANDSVSGSWQYIESRTWNGTKWENLKIISDGKAHNSRDGMPAWTKLSNGYYVLVIEATTHKNNGHPFVIQLLYSKDGNNWSNPVDIFIPKGSGTKAAAPGIVELSTGQLVISFQTDEDSDIKGDANSIVKTIYSDGTSIDKITKNNFSKAQTVFTSGNRIWSGISYKDGWLYVAGGSMFKRLYVG